jgi:tripartite-type tricarboxylate transporter receptor subunit TctC
LYNEDPAGLQVRADAEWQNAQQLLDEVKANAGQHKASGTGQGGIWHLALAGMLQEAGIAPDAAPWVPSQGAAPGLQDLVAGGVDIVTCSVPEAQALLEAGRVRSLAVMSAERNPTFPDVPTLKEATGLGWTIAAWRGVAGPASMPQEVVDTLVPVLKEIHDGQEFRDFMAQRGFGVVWRDPEGFREYMAESNEALGSVMKAVGIAN